MTVARRDVLAALESKGFTRVDGRDHHTFRLEVGGLTQAVSTKVSMGTAYKTIGAPLVAKMSRQMRLSKASFLMFVDCHLSADDYLRLLRDQGVLRHDGGGGDG